MDNRLNAVKGSQGNISFSDTSSLTIVDDAATYMELEHEKTSIEINDKSASQDDQVDLLCDETIGPMQSVHGNQHQVTQFQQQRWWWQNTATTTTTTTTTTAQDTVNINDTTSWKTTMIQQLQQFIQYMRQLDRRQILEYVVRWRWILLFFGLSLIMGIIMWIWRRDLLHLLETLSIAVRAMGTSGQILIFFLIFASAFPPMIGYGTFQSLSGFTFGFNVGFPISYFSALFGAIVCFMVSRRWLKLQVKNIMAKYPNLEAVVKAVEKKGFKLFVLIRLSPYPFNVLNVLFASTDIPLSHFALGTAISLIKIALHVYIGAHLTSFAKHVLGDGDDLSDSERRADTIREIAVVIGSILATGVMIYIYFVAKRAVDEVRQESEEARAFLGLNNNIINDDGGGGLQHDDHISNGIQITTEQMTVTDDWIGWNESDEEKTIHGHDSSGDLVVYHIV